jgi:hypothetical protein
MVNFLCPSGYSVLYFLKFSCCDFRTKYTLSNGNEHRLTGLFVKHGLPEHIGSDNGPEFTIMVVRKWLKRLCVETLSIDPGSPWENSYNANVTNVKFRDERPNG